MTGDALRMAEEAARRAALAAAYDAPARSYLRRPPRLTLPRQRTETNLGETDSSQRPPAVQEVPDGSGNGGGSTAGGGGGGKFVTDVYWDAANNRLVVTYTTGSPRYINTTTCD